MSCGSVKQVYKKYTFPFKPSENRVSTRQQLKQFISANPSVMLCRIKYVCIQYAPSLSADVYYSVSRGHLLDCNKTCEIKITNIQNIMFSLPLLRYQERSKIPLRWQLNFSISPDYNLLHTKRITLNELRRQFGKKSV